MRYTQPFTVFKRKLKTCTVYYFQARDPETNRRTIAKSTGKTTRQDAIIYCYELLRQGRLFERSANNSITLSKWCKKFHWWEWPGDEPLCEFCKKELARSSKEKPKIQKQTADLRYYFLTHYILIEHGNIRLIDIKPNNLEKFMMKLKDKGMAGSTINSICTIYKIMLKEAVKQDLILNNPWDKVEKFYVPEKKRGCLTLDEFKRLMNPATVNEVWGNVLYYYINLVASVTGMRISEILALKLDNIKDNYIVLKSKYSSVYGEGMQKTKRGTDNIPIPNSLAVQLRTVFNHPGYIFSVNESGLKPASRKSVTNYTFKAFEKIGITKEDKGKRNIVFHSWRVFANTYFLSSGVAAEKVREVTRHQTEKMTEHYTSFSMDDFKEISEAQNKLLDFDSH